MKNMFTKSQLAKIKNDIQDFFDKMGFSVNIDAKIQDETLSVNLKVEEPQILIGERGKILLCLQRVLQAILSRKLESKFYLDLDINDYKKKKIQYLKEMANGVADEVVLAKEDRVLPPMPAYERRLIHLELADRKNVTTESIGQEPDRRVIIKPYP